MINVKVYYWYTPKSDNILSNDLMFYLAIDYTKFVPNTARAGGVIIIFNPDLTVIIAFENCTDWSSVT